MYWIYQPGNNTPHRRSTQKSDGFHVLWNLLTFQKERLVWAGRKCWNAINRWGRTFTRPGLAVKKKGRARSPNTRPRKWTCDLSPPQGLNHMVPDAQAADAQIFVSWFPMWWDTLLSKQRYYQYWTFDRLISSPVLTGHLLMLLLSHFSRVQLCATP